MNNILLLEQYDKMAGLYLKLKYIYDKTDKQIAKKMKVTDRTLRTYKTRAYFQIAVWSNKVEYIYYKTFHFNIDWYIWCGNIHILLHTKELNKLWKKEIF